MKTVANEKAVLEIKNYGAEGPLRDIQTQSTPRCAMQVDQAGEPTS